MTFKGYLRPNGSIGIRNKILVIAVDECCDGIAQGIAKSNENAIVLTNSYTCMLGGNEETYIQLIELGKHQNIAGVIVVGMGCGSFPVDLISAAIREAKKTVYEIVCQEVGGTVKAINLGKSYVEEIQNYINTLVREEFPISKLVVAAKCGGSDTSSAIASNPSVGLFLDNLVVAGGVGMSGELFELQGCNDSLIPRAINGKVANKIEKLIANEHKRWSVQGADVETMCIGNSLGGISTIEEKSLGALHKTGDGPITDILQINRKFIDKPIKPGFYLTEAAMLCGAAAVNFASFGAHIILWTSGAAGFENSIVPVIRVSGNIDMFNDDMDINACGIIEGTCSVDDVAKNILNKVVDIASGEKTIIEDIGGTSLTLYQKEARVEQLLNITPCEKI